MHIARKVLETCLNVQPREKLLLISDTRADEALTAMLLAVGTSLNADVMQVTLPWQRPMPHGYLTFEEPPESFTALLCDADAVVDYRTTCLALTAAKRRALAAGTRILWMSGELDYLRPVAMEEDYEAMETLARGIVDVLKDGREIRFSCPLGTDLRMSMRQDRPVSFHTPLVREPGHDDFFPTGMWHLSPDESSVQGTAVLAGNVHPLGVLNSPLVVRFDDGRITSIEGERAAEFRRWLNSFEDDRIFGFSHTGGGLARQADVFGHDWEDLILYGSALISAGSNTYYGGSNDGKGHFDAVVLRATIEVDGRRICQAGEYLPELTGGMSG
jgi:leucyl aminopeptidase (aminopeptidase T)